MQAATEPQTEAVVNAEGEPLAISRVSAPLPTRGDDECLIEVEAFSVNRGELVLLANRPAGWRPGQDVAGVVVGPAANGEGPKAGERVAALVEGGGWARHVAAPLDRVAVTPAGVGSDAAATLGIAGVTALRTLRLGGGLLGAPVAITGASGAVGRFAVQLATVQGAAVTAIADERHADELRALGAVEVLADPAAAAGLFAFAIESIGGEMLAKTIAAIEPAGTIVLIGSASGEPTPISIFDFFGHEGARILTYFSYASSDGIDRDLSVLLGLLDDGRLSAPIGLALPWEDLADGLRALADRQVPGKLVLTIA